jgi:hypothetical protein
LNEVEEATFAVVEPDSATAPTPGETDADVAFCEVQVSVTVPPPVGSVAGEAVNVPVGTGGADPPVPAVTINTPNSGCVLNG